MARLNSNLNMRIESDLLEEFKRLCGKNYQKKLRDIIKAYVDKYSSIEKKEQELRNTNLNVESYLR